MAKIKKTLTSNTGKDVRKDDPSFTVDGIANWCSNYGNQFGELPYNPAILFLGK